MKNSNDIETLVRDLDNLGVQDEIVMDLTIEESITSNTSKEGYKECNRHNPKEEYEACLTYNDNHKVKIERIEGIIKICKYNSFRGLIYGIDMMSIEIKFRVGFSDQSHLLIFKRDQVVETYIEYGNPGKWIKNIWINMEVYNKQIEKGTIISLIDNLISEIERFPDE